MGHYDECREGYCNRCGQTNGYCEHTAHLKNNLKSCYCTTDYNQNIFCVSTRYHSSGKVTQQQIPTNFCPFCGNDLRIR